MIIENQQKQVEIQTDGEASQSIDMVIDESSIGILMNFLSKNIYSDPIGSPIREWASNAWDANVKAGVNNPILVSLTKLSHYKWEFSVEDTALGLDDQDIENVIKKYLCSTKRQDNTQLGALGVGFKSGLAYTNSFTFRCRKNGKERTYIMYEGEFGNKIDLLHEQDTSEANGVKMTLEVKNYDVSAFSKKIREQLAYFSNTFITDDHNTFNNDYKIYENDLFKWSEVTTDKKLHLCLGEVYYPMDFSKLGLSDIYIPVAIKLELSDKVNPTISRESLMFTPESKELILNKIKAVADWFIDQYNGKIDTFKTFPEGYDFIDKSDYNVVVGDKEFCINTIVSLSSKVLKNPEIEGITYKPVSFYKTQFSKLLDCYETVAWDDYNNTWKRKHISWELGRRAIDSPQDIILIDFVLTGNLKAFLREKYGPKTLYVEEKYPRDLYWYKQTLWLSKHKKEDWRAVIKEFQFIKEQVTGRWNNEKGLELKDEYINWLADRKLKLKENREKGISTGNYKTLNKQKGEITLNIARSHRRDSSVVYDKQTCKIEDLKKLPRLNILVNKETDKEELYKYICTFPEIKFLWIGERELKHVKDLHNFKDMEELKKTKPFSRLVTGLFIENILSVVPDNEEIIYKTFPKYEKLKHRIEIYLQNIRVEDYYSVDNELKPILLEVAEETNCWDMNIYTECLEFKKIMSKFGFLSVLNLQERYQTSEALRVAKNMVYIMLKWQSLNGQLVEDMELVPKIPDEVFEQQAVQVELEEELQDA